MKSKGILLKLLLATLFMSCQEIIVEDISSSPVMLVAPSDSVQTRNGKQQFVWDGLTGAENYRLSIALPGFDRVEFMVLDTVLTKTKFEVSLDSGTYQWRVRAQNSAYLGPYVTRTLFISPGS